MLMNRTWRLKVCAPIAGAVLLAGCTQEVGNGGTQNRTPIDNATNQQKQNPQVSLTGCVTTGIGTNQFMLRDIRPAALAEQPTDALSSTNSKIPDNVPVRLAMADADEIEKLVGQTVSVTGTLSDGANTIGTTGDQKGPGQTQPRTDQSQAATPQHHSEKVREEAGPIGTQSMNNGTFPELRVTKVAGTGQKCVANRVEDRR
jgi:hypothetical protein